MTTRTFWLSFCDPTKPAGSRFLGVSVVDVELPADASERTIVMAVMSTAWAEGCNPGGEMLSCELPRNAHTDSIPRNRILDSVTLEKFGERDV